MMNLLSNNYDKFFLPLFKAKYFIFHEVQILKTEKRHMNIIMYLLTFQASSTLCCSKNPIKLTYQFLANNHRIILHKI